MKTKRQIFYSGAIAIIALVTYNLLVFVLSDERTRVFWIAYSFTMISLMIQLTMPVYLMFDSQIRKDKYLGLPITVICSFYSVIQLIAGIVLMLTPVSTKLATLIETIILGIFFILAISTISGIDHIVTNDDVMKSKTIFVRSLRLKIAKLYNEATDGAVKEKLKKLLDVVRYSDPVSNIYIAPIEQHIESSFDLLVSKLGTGSFDEAGTEIDTIIKLFNERDRQCKMMK